MSQLAVSLPPVDVAVARRRVAVLVVHPEEVVRCGWRLVLSREPWAERCLDAADEPSAVALAHRYSPTVAILDLDLGQDTVARAAGAIRQASPQTRLLLVAGQTAISPKAAQFLGATGVVSKFLPGPDLTTAVLAVASDQRVHAAPTPRGAGRLSAREREVLHLLSDGATNAEIAAKLHLSRETIKQHAAAIYRKLEVRNRTEAARRGKEMGLELGLQP